MPHWLLQAGIIISRTLAATLGCFAFYLAFFLYETEQGEWQNRLESLWVSIDERATITRNTATALFNRVAQLSSLAMDRLFGKQLLSLRALCVFTNISLAGGILFAATLDQLVKRQIIIPPRGSTSVLRAVLLRDLPFIYEFLFERFVFVRPHTWAASSFLTAVLISLCLLASGIVPAFKGNKWLNSLPYLFSGAFLARVVFLWTTSLGQTHSLRTHYELMFESFMLSFLCDYLAVTTLRRLLLVISRSPSAMRVAFSVLILGLLSASIIYLPVMLAIVHGIVFKRHLSIAIYAGFLGELLGALSVTTFIYFALPAGILLLILVHRIVWPFISRFIYSLGRYNILSNTKLLSGAGFVCLALAISIGHLTRKDILDLLSKLR